MSRLARYDTDDERLPEGMTRVGYDADDQVTTYQDTDGSLWDTAPGNQYGRLTRVSGPRAEDDEDSSFDFLQEQIVPERSWRTEMMPLLNFGVIIGLFLLFLFWYLHITASSSKDSPAEAACPVLSVPYTVRKGDTCWDIADSHDFALEDIEALNPKLDCSKLVAGGIMCVPEPHGPI